MILHVVAGLLAKSAGRAECARQKVTPGKQAGMIQPPGPAVPERQAVARGLVSDRLVTGRRPQPPQGGQWVLRGLPRP